MAVHDDNRKRDKKDSGVGKVNPVDPDRSEERSWIQRRTTDLYMAQNELTGEVDNARWAVCYKQAKEEWIGKEADKTVD